MKVINYFLGCRVMVVTSQDPKNSLSNGVSVTALLATVGEEATQTIALPSLPTIHCRINFR